MIRLAPFAGLQIGVGKPYGTNQYGLIGYGIKSLPGSPQLSAELFLEEEDNIAAHIYPIGTQIYGTGGVAQATTQIPVDRTRFDGDRVYSVEFNEDDTLDVIMRIKPDGTLHCHEFVEV